MPTLHVRSVPDDLYERIQKLAQAKNRSLSAQVITLLYQALEEEATPQHQRKLLNTMRRRFTPPKGTPDVTAMLRQDRRR